MLLDGQVFTHAVIGILCGIVTVICGIALAQRPREPRWACWTFVALGLALGIWCGIESPSAYHFQQKFNK